MPTATYQVILKDPITGDQWELLPKSYNFTETLNKESTAEFYFSFRELEILAAKTDTTVLNMFTSALREIYILRNNVKIYYGVVAEFLAQPVKDGDITVTIKSFSFLALFKKRLVGIGVEEDYASTDAGEIAWSLIDNSQLEDDPYSDYGITEGSITASKDRDRSYLFDNVYEEIIRLSNENLADGFDFDIDNTKAFNVYYPTKGQSRPNIVFDIRTSTGWRYNKKLFTDMANKVYVLGEGFNEDISYVTRTASTALRTPFGTLEEKIDARNVTVTETLEDKGDARLAEASAPRVILNGLEHFDNQIGISDYNVGDTVVVNLPDLAIENESVRVKSRRFTMETPQSIGSISLTVE